MGDNVVGVLTNNSLWRGSPRRLPRLHRPRLLAAVTSTKDHPLMSLRDGLVSEAIPLDPYSFYLILAHDGLTLFPPDEQESRSKSHQSGARYLAHGQAGDDSLLLQMLPPHTLTSCHFHRRTTEHFLNLIGSCTVGTRDLMDPALPCQYQRLAGNQMLVPRFCVHQLQSGSALTINLLIMRGLIWPLRHPLDMSDHFYVDPSPFTF